MLLTVLSYMLVVQLSAGIFVTHIKHNYPFKNETVVEDKHGNILLKVIAVPVPLATTTKVIGINKDGIHVGVVSASIRGKANREIMEHVAKVLGVHLVHISLLEGTRYKRKTLMLPQGISSVDVVKSKLNEDMLNDD